MTSLYLHVPFCFHKCHYCDFYSFVDGRDQQDAFTAALSAEIRTLAAHAGGHPGGGGRDGRLPRDPRPRLDTLFIGGGTPTLLRLDLWDRLITAIHDAFRIAPDAEWTVECNPETVTPALLGLLAGGGVNRVSIGAQSFDPALLAVLERWHEPPSVRRALEAAADAGIPRRSVDLIFAIPGQTRGGWMADLGAALAMADEGLIEHLSAYALTYEPNTPMTARLRRGDFLPATDDLEAAMYADTVAACRDHGLERYEVSNFARPGAASRHNLVYWRSEEWLAGGPSASAHASGHRWKNVPRITEWMDAVAATPGYAAIVDHEPPDPRRALAERLMMGLRLAEGLDEPAITADAAALGVDGAVRGVLDQAVDAGLLMRADRRIGPTDRGFLFVDQVAGDALEAVTG